MGDDVYVDGVVVKHETGKRRPSELVPWDTVCGDDWYISDVVDLERFFLMCHFNPTGALRHVGKFDAVIETLSDEIYKTQKLSPHTQLEKVYEFGASTKYSPNGWKVGVPISALAVAGWRHVSAFLEGELINEESGLSHLAHALWQAVAIKWMVENKPEMAK